ncbi:TPA: hypothetical protein ACKQGZ_001029 [Serratia marcescens]|uniref:hypothetical protein n=1 Tax=Serratia marcescens TaxID=615 RepID=UPI000A40239C|nr:hypothetical protein [Serratia marcescens]HBN5183172.1 hypothetical protein [Serratia marcescens]
MVSSIVKIIFVLFLVVNGKFVFAGMSWGSPYKIEGKKLRYSWGIDMTGGFDGTVSCGTSKCYFGVFPRTGLGPNGQMCDSGGICILGPSSGNSGDTAYAVVIPNGTSMTNAYKTFCERKGCYGEVLNIDATWGIDDPRIAWGKLCVGFAHLPYNVRSVSVSASGTSCGVISPPNKYCDVFIPSIVDLGQVSTGFVNVKNYVYGRGECNGITKISAALLSLPYLQGNKVEIAVNDIPLNNEAKIVGEGKSIPLSLSAKVEGEFRNPGVYSDNAVVLLSFL